MCSVRTVISANHLCGSVLVTWGQQASFYGPVLTVTLVHGVGGDEDTDTHAENTFHTNLPPPDCANDLEESDTLIFNVLQLMRSHQNPLRAHLANSRERSHTQPLPRWNSTERVETPVRSVWRHNSNIIPSIHRYDKIVGPPVEKNQTQTQTKIAIFIPFNLLQSFSQSLPNILGGW